MNLPFQVKVPIDTAVELRNRLHSVEAIHHKALDRFAQKMRCGGDAEEILDEQRSLAERGRRVTIQHLLRVFIMRGMAEMEKARPEELLALMNSDAIVVGRPGAEAKRGTRAA